MAEYLECAPSQIRIARACKTCGAPHGRPTLLGADIDYSVSHTRRRLVVVVVGQGRVGVDIEEAAQSTGLAQLAGTVLTESESRTCVQTPPKERDAFVLRAWSRKEAAAKVTGHGLQVPFDQLDVSGARVSLRDQPVDWPSAPIHLWDRPFQDHVMTIASTRVLDHLAMREGAPTASVPP